MNNELLQNYCTARIRKPVPRAQAKFTLSFAYSDLAATTTEVGIRILPKREEILIRGAGFCGVALHGVGSTDLQMRECTDGRVQYDATMVEKLFGTRLRPVNLDAAPGAPRRARMRIASRPERVVNNSVRMRLRLQELNSLCRVLVGQFYGSTE